MPKIEKVIIFGGTHGNEMSGIFLVNKWTENSKELKSRLTSCPIQVHIANPEAVKLCRRYKDCDLNRQFTEENYNKVKNNLDCLPYEIKRASELREMVDNFSAPEKQQLLIDLHNTTSNVGCTIIVSCTADIFTMHLAAYVQMNMKKDGWDSEILSLGKKNYGCTRSLAKHGIAIEVGPQPQGVLRADILKCQEEAVFYSLDFVDKFNTGCTFPASEIKSFTIVEKVGFPNNSSSKSVIHENIQDKDFQALSRSGAVFRTVENKILSLEDVVKLDDLPQTLYPMFVNEAAYYEKNLAFWLTTLETLQLPYFKLNH